MNELEAGIEVSTLLAPAASAVDVGWGGHGSHIYCRGEFLEDS
jgi:hypothetical protein